MEHELVNATFNQCLSPDSKYRGQETIGGSPNNPGILLSMFSLPMPTGYSTDMSVTADGCSLVGSRTLVNSNGGIYFEIIII